MNRAVIVAAAMCVAVAACSPAQEALVPKTETQVQTDGATSKLQAMAQRFVPTEIAADVSRLAPADRQVLARLVQASKIMDALFMRQVWAGNEAMLLDLVRDETPEGRARLHYFLINKAPWSRLDHNEAFVPGAPPKPEAANFYPDGAAKADIERWIASLPAPERARANGFFTLVRRAGQSFT